MTELFVNIGELKVLRGKGKLIAIGLGSCVGVALIDAEEQVAGLAHVFLHTSNNRQSETQPGKFADTAIDALLEAVLRQGAKRERLQAKIAGGACLFPSISGATTCVGELNVQAVLKHLGKAGIVLAGKDVGGSLGRKMTVDVSDGSVFVQTIGQEPRRM
ncbi:MAG: chemotaxis protein CheD [Firmicutes bacterium]|nr:chemotaxis protein CheD [Bacillota bacterium]